MGESEIPLSDGDSPLVTETRVWGSGEECWNGFGQDGSETYFVCTIKIKRCTW